MSHEKPSQNTSGESVSRQLTPRQQMALATDRNLSVTAGAGSGKTTILVERYLKLIIEERVDLRRVLAITFTDKAAAEMRERVARVLHQRLSQAPTGRSGERERLLELRERLNSAQISTIHSFCSRILREFAVACAVDPDFSVMNEFQQSLLASQAIDETLGRLDGGTLESSFTRQEWLEFLRQVPPATLREVLKEALAHPYEIQRCAERLEAHDDADLYQKLHEHFFAELDRQLDRQALLAKAVPAIRGLKAVWPDNPDLKPEAQRLRTAMDEFLSVGGVESDKVEVWQKLMVIAGIATTNGKAYSRLTSFGTKAQLGAAAPALLKLSEALEPLGRFCKEIISVAPAEIDLLHFQALRKILFLYQQVSAGYHAAKDERGVLDYDDLQLRALELLKSHPEVVQTLRERYRFIMVDEFQDTSELQWEIISRIGQEEGRLDTDKFFVVGDPKQSIYGFRNADVRVFERVKQQFAGGQNAPPGGYDGNVVLEESFRFLPGLNRFINFLFERVLRPAPGNEFEVGYDPLSTRREEDGGAVHAAFLAAETGDEESDSQEAFVAKAIVQLLQEPAEVYRREGAGESRQPIRPGDIAVLIPARTHLPEMEMQLRRFSIPFKTIGGVGFYRRQEIYDVYHLLRYLNNPADELALVALLRSPFAGISDAALFHLSLTAPDSYRQKLDETAAVKALSKQDRCKLELFRRQLAHWEQRRDRLPLSRFLSEILEESFYRATAAAQWQGEQVLANLDKIIEQARDYEQGGFMALGDFIESLHQLIQADPREGEAQIALEDEGSVKVMTIHTAKGLEFPVVFCPYLERTTHSDRSRSRLDSDLGLAVPVGNPGNGYQREKPFLYELLNYREKQKRVAELKRLLYVGLTRARDRLYLIARCKKGDLGKENALSWVCEALNIDWPFISAAAQEPDGGIKSLPLAEDLSIEASFSSPPATPPQADHHEVEKGIALLRETLESAADTDGQTPAAGRFSPVEACPAGVTFSATQLETFAADPSKYFQRYHLGFFESDYEFVKQISDPDNISLLKGKLVHRVLEEGVPLHPAEVERRLNQALFQFEVFDEETQADLRREIPPLILRFAASADAAEFYAAAQWKSEVSLTMRLGEDYFTGTLDRIFQNEQGAWEVLDYKTNHISAGEVRKTAQKYRMQMESYALLVARLFPGQSQYPVTLYFLHPGAAHREVFTPAQIEKIENKFAGLIAEIKQFHPFNPMNIPGES